MTNGDFDEQYLIPESGAVIQDYLDDFLYTSWYTGKRDLIELDSYGFPTEANFRVSTDPLVGTTVRQSIDFQGIPWGNEAIGPREYFRLYRLHTYSLACNHSDWSPDELSIDDVRISPYDPFFEFHTFYKTPVCVKNHFHLCKNLAFFGEYSILYVSNSGIQGQNLLTKEVADVFDFRNSILQKNSICCLSTSQQLGCFSTLYGQYGIFNPKTQSCSIRKMHDESINHIQLLDYKGLAVLGCNDGTVALEDIEKTGNQVIFRGTDAVNSIHPSPDLSLLLICSDCKRVPLFDWRSNQVVDEIFHSDSVLTGSWHPNGHILATGGQDTTLKIWDSRFFKYPIRTLGSQMSAVTNVVFSSTGDSLAAVEQADFAQIYNTKTFSDCQVIDFFGEVSGANFSPSGDTFIVGLDDPMLGGIMEFRTSIPSHLTCFF
ncbi:WD40/YVTN repeat-like protein [Schizosaccharomyces cryophilus OY26]|uniref:WD40/YVTN repeat-like protein n=1 Tax=Schizosaccharomyces cryophilus (strain OY26 / ATCC MYA-4695 / CBS 11777 / NBRC 106824 / NRRL Y48691) TaxID=653667 RepID=S9W1N0_SCHCR|nr:WD40/YVTN repeat-like protein [Schizosaccharomyces cryophilus OY26]EPY53918.1 WD40/YVTN repeat-like protein [Schizosaccharomyces cryophilus OY26]